MRDKVVLVNPGVSFQKTPSYGMYPNTAVMILATILHNAGFGVKVIDGRYLTMDDAAKAISDEADSSLIFIGFSVMTIQLSWAYYVSQAVKSRSPDVPVVWGGTHPTLFPEETVRDKAIDIVAANDAASTIVPLASALASGSNLASVPGIYFKKGSQIIANGMNSDRDTFKNIPFIDFSLINHERYSRNNCVAIEEFYAGRYADSKVYPIITGLGCTYRCTFCINPILERKYFFRDAAEIVDRIEYLNKAYGADFIQPMDENFFISRKRTFELLDLLEKRALRIKWRPQARVDYFCEKYINLDVARRLERSGMVVAAMGVESASQNILDKLKKQLMVEDIIRAMEILSKTNIVPKMNFMVGLPGETDDDIKKTYRLALKLRGMAKRSCVTISPFRPYPGSDLYDELVSKYGYSPPSSLKDWAKLSEREFNESKGYESFRGYKWIERPRRFEAMLSVYDEIAWYKPNRDDKWYGKWIYYIAFSSIRFNFFVLVHVIKESLYLILKMMRSIRYIMENARHS